MVIVQIVVLEVQVSLDSVITAVGTWCNILIGHDDCGDHRDRHYVVGV